jgi:CHASE3 domain sensor protein
MTIGKKLYFGFGAILAIMLFLLAINIFTVVRQYGRAVGGSDTLQDVQTIESVRYDMMENRLSLGNYLLSGDLRDEEKTNKGITDLARCSAE